MFTLRNNQVTSTDITTTSNFDYNICYTTSTIKTNQIDVDVTGINIAPSATFITTMHNQKIP